MQKKNEVKFKKIIKSFLLLIMLIQILAISGCIPLLVGGAAGGAAGYYIGKDKDKKSDSEKK